MTNLFPFCMVIVYVLPILRVTSRLVQEKGSGLRAYMQVMGMRPTGYWLCWLLYYSAVSTTISAMCTLLLCVKVLPNSSPGLIFLYLWLYGLSHFGYVVLMQSFFKTPRTAAVVSTLVFFFTSFLDQAVANPYVSELQKSAGAILPTIAMSRAIVNIQAFEISGHGFQTDNVSTLYYGYRVETSLWLFVVSGVAMGLLGLVFETFNFKQLVRRVLGRKRLPDTQDPAKPRRQEDYEETRGDLVKQETDGQVLAIEDLRKTFKNGFVAVKGLSLKMYTGQIFALLGHNGAGKTTTISMLTGLLQASGGNAEVFGVDILSDIAAVREFLGVCPQHDVLFDLLTPYEHLLIFSDFKGTVYNYRRRTLNL